LQCPKCSYVRGTEDHAPDWQCPRCGVVYHKYKAAEAPEGVELQTGISSSPAKSAISFRKLRIAILLIILVVVSLDSWLAVQRSTSWDNPLWVVVYPINAENSAEVAEYISSLRSDDFSSIENYFVTQAKRYGLTLKDPVALRLGPSVQEIPPLPPANGSILKVMWWSLKLRYWSMAVDQYDGPRPDIRVFVLYHKAEKNKHLAHSTGLQKGMVSVVHAFADVRLAARNNVVIAHEMMHTLGATDKYDLLSGQPLFPAGYAEPDRQPLLPQRYGEIMGAYIPQTETKWSMPESLARTLVGDKTATEIGWLGRD
jgi:hypothetical protein